MHERWKGAAIAMALLVSACGRQPAAEHAPEGTGDPTTGDADARDLLDASADADAGCRLYDCLGPKDDHEHDDETAHRRPTNYGKRTEELATACAQMAADATRATAAATREGALEHVITPSEVAYEVELPANGRVFLSVRVAQRHTDTTFYVEQGSGLAALHDDDAVVFTFDDGILSNHCPTTFEEFHLWHVHAPGAYVLEFEAGEARTARFLVESERSDHFGGGEEEDAGTTDADAGAPGGGE